MMEIKPHSPVTVAFGNYRVAYGTRPYNADRVRNADECKLLTSSDGVSDFSPPPINNIQAGNPPIQRTNEKEITREPTYIWVIMPSKIPYILEEAAIRHTLTSQRVTHTNLSGGSNAHCGGELWFKDTQAFVLSGGSGRYPPRNKKELDTIVSAFRECGFKVASLGWDEEVSGPVRYLRDPSTLEWS